MHITSLQTSVVDLSSDDDDADSSDSNDDFSPILFPPGFQPACIPPPSSMLIPLDPAGQQMTGQHILFKWPKYGWCFGKITEWNSNPKRTVCGQIVNFIVCYPGDCSSGPHCLSLDNYNTHTDNDFPNHTWLLLEQLPPQQRARRQPECTPSLRPDTDLTSTPTPAHILTPQGGRAHRRFPVLKILPDESKLVNILARRTIGSALLWGQQAHWLPQ